MGGLAAAGEECAKGELFYYFASLRRYWRAVRLAGLCALGLLLPAIWIGGTLLVFFVWYLDLLLADSFAAIFVLIGGVVAVLALCVFSLLLAGFYLPFAAVAVGNEDISLGRACLRGLCMGRARLFVWFRFSLRILLHMLIFVFLCFSYLPIKCK